MHDPDCAHACRDLKQVPSFHFDQPGCSSSCELASPRLAIWQSATGGQPKQVTSPLCHHSDTQAGRLPGTATCNPPHRDSVSSATNSRGDSPAWSLSQSHASPEPDAHQSSIVRQSKQVRSIVGVHFTSTSQVSGLLALGGSCAAHTRSSHCDLAACIP